MAIWALLAASSQNDAKMPQDFDGFQDLQVISSFLGLRIEGFGGPGARNWRTPHGGGGHEHPQGWEQGEHHSTDPRTAENALPPASRGLRSEVRRAKAPLKRLVIYYGAETRIARSMYEG